MNKFSVITNVLSLIVISLFLYTNYAGTNKVGYVDNDQLLLKYKGYSEAQDEYVEKEQEWQANLDTLESDLKKAFIEFKEKQPSLNSEELAREEQILQYRKNNFLQAKEKFQANLDQENARLMAVVSNQIEAYINEYAQTENYDVIVGITDQGNVLYSDMNKNITEELLIGLNGSYEGI